MACATETVQSWWDYVWQLRLEDIAAGKVISMFDPMSVSFLRGADNRLSNLYVRRMYEPLYLEILHQSAFGNNDWLCHLNGNAGVGKSAFLWYFIVSSAVQLRDSNVPLHILYESAGFIWEFKGRTARVAKRDDLPVETFRDATWHLINQKVPEVGAIGPVVLVAASPAKENVKAAKADRKKTVMYMYPWEEDEFNDLVELWKTHYKRLDEELKSIKECLGCLEDWAKEEFKFKEVTLRYALARSDLSQLPKLKAQVRGMVQEGLQKTTAASSLAFRLQVFIRLLKAQVEDGDKRLKAAPDFYKWFGGVVRPLWSAHFESLNPEAYSERVKESLKKTNLRQLLNCVQDKSQADDISWALLHFLKPPGKSSFLDYYLDFCSPKVRDEFTALTLTRSQAQELEVFMQSAAEIGHYRVLRGYVFEELSIAHVLHGATLSIKPMVDCEKCKSRGDRSRKWIACDVCDKWYHFSCGKVSRHTNEDGFWQCPSCEGEPNEPTLLHPRRLLRYYEGNLKTALLEAGAEAMNYVWRPVIKNNGAVDYTILPWTLMQPTIAGRHTVAAGALEAHIDALRAWNALYGEPTKQQTYVLCFCLAQSNYAEFGFQSYRDDKSRRVTKQAVKGIRQCKVLLRYDTPLAPVEEMEVPKDVEMVDDFTLCKFDGEVAEASYFDPDEKDIVPRHEEVAVRRRLVYCP